MIVSRNPLARLVAAWIATALLLAALPPVSANEQSPEAVVRKAAESVLRVRAIVPADARSARTLGTERSGSGVVIDSSGLVLTIGYVILEAMSVTVTTNDGRNIPAEVLAYDYDTGFGLLRPVLPLGLAPLPLGDSKSLAENTPAVVIGAGGFERVMPAVVVSRREFAGYWEYMLDDAIFTSPPYDDWGGAALVGLDGRLLGIGSLFVADARQGERQIPGNMFVPVHLLRPILADLLTDGRSGAPPKPWLGVSTQSAQGRLFITRLTPGGPAEQAGLRQGDLLLRIGDETIGSIADFYRKLWARGAAGVEVPVTVRRDGAEQRIMVKTGDRYQYMQFRRTY